MLKMESFPQGGKKPGVKRPADRLLEEKFRSKKHKTQTKKKNNEIVETNLITTTADQLSCMKLIEGLTLLGRVSKVSDYDLLVSLPGGFLGRVESTDICQSYTNLLEDIVYTRAIPNEFKYLPDLYKPGDYVTCYIKSIDEKEKWFCGLSMEPQLINQYVHTNNLTKDTKVVCAVKSIEDHGYIVDTGLANIRAFVATEDVRKGKQYFPGNQLLCTIKKIQTVDQTSFIKLSTKKKKIDRANVHDIISLGVLTPGTKLPLCVTKVLVAGVQVRFGKDNVGYINQIYLNNPLSTYVENMEVTGTLLYILPLQKLAFFSLLTDTSEKEKLRVGDIKKGKVLYRNDHGVTLKLSKSGLRGFVSLRRTNIPYFKILAQFKEGSTHECRILTYNWMEHCYVCTMEEKIMKQKYPSANNLNIGDILTVTIMHFESRSTLDYIIVQAKEIYGIVPSEHVSDSGLSALHKLKVGDNVEARVLDKIDENQVKFTLKQSLIKSKLPVLHDFDEAKCGSNYHGTISMINKKGLLVRFYGLVKGWVPRTTLDSDTCDMNWNFFIGQTVTMCVESVHNFRMKLRIVTEEQQSVTFSIGEMVRGTVTDLSDEGVYLKIQKEDNVVTGFLPAGHMAPCIEIGSLLAMKCIPGDVISALVFATKPIVLSRTFVPPKKYRSFDLLEVGDCIPCSVQDISQDGIRVILSIENYAKLGFVSYKNVSNFEQVRVNQILFVKITAINTREKLLTLTMSLKDMWNASAEPEIKMMAAVDVLNLYMNKLAELAKNSFYKNKPIYSAALGQKVTGTVTKVLQHGLVLQLNDQLVGLVQKNHCFGNPKVGDKVFGTILWKSYVGELVAVSLLPKVINSISSKQKTLPELPTEVTLKAEILMMTNWFILVLVKCNGAGYLATIPVRRHLNDNSPDLTPYKTHAKIRLYVIIKRDEADIVPICMLKSAFESPKKTIVTELSTIKDKKLKRKKVSEPHDTDSASSPAKKVKVVPKKPLKKTSQEEKEKKNEIEVEEEEDEIKDIHESPESNGFFLDKKEKLAAANTETSNDDEEEPEEDPKRKKKKKKLSAAERREQERQKERKIRQREEALASNLVPNSVDQFNRLVLSSPNDSWLWKHYITYHLQATEIDKARAVVRRALKTINFREKNELLNIWIAWMNLESQYGTAESLNDVFQEALKTNDAFEVYKNMLYVHADAGRKAELEKLVDKAIGKFKQNSNMWVTCGIVLMKIGMKEKSRQMMQRALQSLAAFEHVTYLLRFAYLEDNWGDKERAQTLFEDILSSYPKNVGMWSCYVDYLVKHAKNIDLARKKLEQACMLTLPLKKMKTLFTKFINFEKTHGTLEAVARVRQMAASYVDNRINFSNRLQLKIHNPVRII